MRRSDACRMSDYEYPRAGVCNFITGGMATTALLGAFASQALGGMMSDKGSPAALAPPPEIKPPSPMPVAPGASQRAKAEKSLAQQLSMDRASTTLTGDTLG